MVVVVAGCLPRPDPDLRAVVSDAFGWRATLTVQRPPAVQTGQDVMAALRADNPASMYQGRAVPIFGVVDCDGETSCVPGPGGSQGGPPRTVWLVVYPDCTSDTGVLGWAVVDAVNGVAGGYSAIAVCVP
jgi:hypothetical protein